MNNIMRKSSGLLVVFIVAVVVIVASYGLLSTARFDLTENKLFTLSEGTKNILANVDRPIELTLYFSNKGTTELPALRTYANRVTELLEEYASLSHGKVKLTVVDPQAFSEDEDQAVAAGLQGVPVGPRRDQVFFGLVGRSGTASVSTVSTADAEASANTSVDGVKEEVIPFFQLDKESFLEYELTKLVYNLSQPKAAIVGVLSGLDLNGGFDYMSRQRTPAWTVVQQMEDLFELRWLADDVEQIDAEISLLLVVHPKNMPPQTKLAIDQFVLKGGNTIVFVDPVAESEQSGMGGMSAGGDKSSDLPELFAAWGVEYSAAEIVGDYGNSMVVSMGRGSNPVRHIGLLGLDAASMNKDDVVVAGLENINLASTGYLKPQADAKTTFVSLLASSTESMPVKAEAYGVMQSPDELMADFVPTGESYVLAARVMGSASTAFPDGVEIEETVDENSEGEDSTANDESAEPVKKTRIIMPQLNASEAINVIVIADTDMLTDRLWVQVQEFFGQRIAQPWADNAGFVVNTLDNFSGNADLISIRSRGRFSRPFDRVEQLRLQAEEKFQEQQDILEQRLADAERKLAELEQSRNVDDKRLLTPEQEAELASFQNEKLVIRKELREVQHQLDQDIEALGRNLKLINIFLVPLLLTVLVLFLRAATGRRRSAMS